MMLTRDRLQKLLRDAGRAINANDGRCVLIEDVLCEVTTMVCDLLNGTAMLDTLGPRVELLAVIERPPVLKVRDSFREFYERFAAWRLELWAAARKVRQS